MAIGNLACVYKLKGEYVKALDLYRQALAINEAELEPTHAHVTMTLNRVAHSNPWADTPKHCRCIKEP